MIWDTDLALAVRSVGDELDMRRPLVIVDAAVAGHSVVADTISGFAQSVVHQRAGNEPETPEADTLCARARDGACDAVVGIGGGSVLDLAKAVGGLVPASGDAASYQGFNLLPGPALPVVAVPTTAGSGSEVTGTAVLVNRVKGLKLGINSPHIVPKVAVLEPRLLGGMPARLTLTSGMDAISHAVESYSANGATQFTRPLAIRSFQLLVDAVDRSLADGDDLAARADSLIGSAMAGLAVMNAGTGAAHAMAYPLGVHLGVPHSHALTMLLPEVVEACERAQPDLYDELAMIAGGSVSVLLRKLVAPWSSELRLRQYGEPDLALLAAESMNLTSAVQNHPLPFSEADARAILEAVA